MTNYPGLFYAGGERRGNGGRTPKWVGIGKVIVRVCGWWVGFFMCTNLIINRLDYQYHILH